MSVLFVKHRYPVMDRHGRVTAIVCASCCGLDPVTWRGEWQLQEDGRFAWKCWKCMGHELGSQEYEALNPAMHWLHSKGFRTLQMEHCKCETCMSKRSAK